MNFLIFSDSGVSGFLERSKYIGNMFPIGISRYLLNICCEPLVMHLDIRVLGFVSTKVKVMSFFTSSLIVNQSVTQSIFF